MCLLMIGGARRRQPKQSYKCVPGVGTPDVIVLLAKWRSESDAAKFTETRQAFPATIRKTHRNSLNGG
jgi:hypothetical protein